jgi:hypothetical protein
MSTEEKDPHGADDDGDAGELERSVSFRPGSQNSEQTCILYSFTNAAAHNICTQMGWVIADFQIDEPINLYNRCEEECRGAAYESPKCKYCLLKIYIITIISNKFPNIIEEGANLELATLLVNFSFNEIFLSENLEETINRQLSSNVEPHLVTALTNNSNK